MVSGIISTISNRIRTAKCVLKRELYIYRIMAGDTAMIRRKLTAYTCMLIAGIIAGYLFTEKVKLFSAFGFLTASAAGVILFKEIRARERILCLTMLLSGFFLFSLNFAYFESAAADYRQDEEYSWKGRIISAEDKGDYLRFTVRLDKDKKGRSFRAVADYRYFSTGGDDERKEELIGYIGKEAVIYGRLSEFRGSDNPGCFDYRGYMRSRGTAYRIKADHMETRADDGYKWRLRRQLISARERFLSYFDEESGSFLRGLVFGDKSEIDEDVLKEFQHNSTGHILAVSGLHIGFLHSLLRLLSARRRSWPASLMVVSILIIYGEMAMWSPSVIRAVTVISLNIFSVNVRKRFDLLTSISAAAALILLCRPYMLFNSGFQLSFAAMTAIAFFAERLKRYLGNFAATAASVQIGTLPVLAAVFHRVNIIAVLISIPIILLSSFLVPLCLLFLLINICTGAMPAFIVSFIRLCIQALLLINHRLSFNGYFSELTSGPGTAWTVTLAVTMFLLASEWLKVKRLRSEWENVRITVILVIIPMLFVHVALFDPFSDDEIVFVSVGQGDCTHIRAGDEDILIDGGGNEYFNTGEKTLMPYLMYERARNIDIALLTHLHKDHYLGVSELSEIYPVSSVGIPSDYRDSFENSKGAESGIRFETDSIIYLKSRSRITVNDDVYIDILWPLSGKSGGVSIDDPNEHNMVYMINYRGCRIMVTGDLLEEDEKKMLDHYRGKDSLNCDILKIAHHGSKSSSSEKFLDAADPEIAVIQVGRDNLYGHPHDQTLERLRKRGIKTFRTDISGAVGVDIHNNSISIDLYNEDKMQ